MLIPHSEPVVNSPHIQLMTFYIAILAEIVNGMLPAFFEFIKNK